MNLYCYLTNCTQPAPLWFGLVLLVAMLACVAVIVLCVMHLVKPHATVKDESMGNEDTAA